MISNVHLDRAAIAEARDLMVKLNNAWQSIIWAGTGAVPNVQMATVPGGDDWLEQGRTVLKLYQSLTPVEANVYLPPFREEETTTGSK